MGSLIFQFMKHDPSYDRSQFCFHSPFLFVVSLRYTICLSEFRFQGLELFVLLLRSVSILFFLTISQLAPRGYEF
jgi:hypothetical protein